MVGGINSRDNDSVHLLANQHFPELLWFEDGYSGSALAFEYLIVVLRSDCVLVAQGHYDGVGSLGDSINKHQTTGTSAYDSDSARVCGRHDSRSMTNYEEGLRKDDAPLVEFMCDVNYCRPSVAKRPLAGPLWDSGGERPASFLCYW